MTTEKSEKVVNNPLEYGMMTLEEFVNLKAKPYKETSFISSQKILYDKGLKIDGHLSRLMQVNNYIARVDINVPNDKDDKPARFITIKPKIAGIIQNPYAVTLHHNNRTNNKEYDIKYEAEIKQADNDDTLLMTVDYDDIANDRLFKSKVKTLSSLLSSEIPEFIANFITKNNPKNIKEYTNSGRIDITGKMDWLWENAAYINGKMHDADKYGNIPIQNNDYIRVSQKTRRLLPHYYPNSKPVEQVVTDLFNNIFESWNGAIEPFLAISFMAMSPYCPEF